MKIIIITLCAFLSLSSFSQENDSSTPVLSTDAPTVEKEFNPYKGHWLITFGFEGLKYETPYSFAGERISFKPSEQEFWGGRLGFGREVYLGLGLMTTSKIEGYYVGTLFSQSTNAGSYDEAVEFAYIKRTGSVYGVDAAQSIGFLFDMKTKNPVMDEWTYLTVEPYIEAGIGIAQAYNRLNARWDTSGTPSGDLEVYRHRVEDTITNARIGAGVNFTSHTGYFLYLRATVNRYDIIKRKNEGESLNSGVSQNLSSTEKDVKIDPVTVYALGGGYKF